MTWHGKINNTKNQSPIINVLCDFEWVPFPIWACQIKDLGSILLPHPLSVMGSNLVACMVVCMHIGGSSKHKLGPFDQILPQVLFFNSQRCDLFNEPPQVFRGHPLGAGCRVLCCGPASPFDWPTPNNEEPRVPGSQGSLPPCVLRAPRA